MGTDTERGFCCSAAKPGEVVTEPTDATTRTHGTLNAMVSNTSIMPDLLGSLNKMTKSKTGIIRAPLCEAIEHVTHIACK